MLNKKICNIHIGTYLAAFLCFFAGYMENNKDNEYKKIYENGINVVSEIIKKSKYCGQRKGHSWFDVEIEATKEICNVNVSPKICENKKIGDTIYVRYFAGIKRCTIAKYNIGKYGNDKKWFYAFAILLGLGFLIYDFIKNKQDIK